MASVQRLIRNIYQKILYLLVLKTIKLQLIILTIIVIIVLGRNFATDILIKIKIIIPLVDNKHKKIYKLYLLR